MLATRKRCVHSLISAAAKPVVDRPAVRRENRAFTRYLLKIPVACAELNRNFQQTSEFIPARTLNVAEGGLLLVAPQELVSDWISVTFCDWEGTPFDLTTKVIHRSTNGSEFFTGVEFLPTRNLSAYATKLIRMARPPSLNFDLPAPQQD